MEKSEKSIDGLSVRKNKKSVVKNTTPVKSVVKKPAVDKKSPKEARKEFLQPVKSFDLDLTSDDINGKKPKKQKKEKIKKEKKKMGVGKKILIGFLIFVFVTLAGAFAVAMIWGNEIISKITGGGTIWDAISAFVSEDYVDLKTDENGRTNILVFGTSGFDMDGSVGDTHYSGSQLTDSIMVISLDQKTGDVVMTSMPRDLKASRTCTATGKINEMYWCNSRESDEAGANALSSEISKILGISIQYYVHVNWGTLVQIVDSIGGIVVTLDEDINDVNYTGAIVRAGEPTALDGIQALNVARARHGTTGGDFTRGTSQQKILIAIKNKILESGISLADGINMLNSLGDNIRANFTMDEIKTGVHLAQTLDLNNMRHAPLIDYNNGVYLMKTANINGISYVIPSAGEGRYQAIQEYIAKQFNSNAIVREGANILVLNATGEDGVASAERTKLEELGYNIANIDNAPEEMDNAYYIILMNNSAYGTMLTLEDHYNEDHLGAEELPEGIDASNYDIVLILGKASLKK